MLKYRNCTHLGITTVRGVKPMVPLILGKTGMLHRHDRLEQPGAKEARKEEHWLH
jgi:hypothetical protein